MIKKLLALSVIIVASSTSLYAQTLPVGLLENVEDSYRRQQLLGNDSSNSSYLIRPLVISSLKEVTFDSDSLSYSSHTLRKLLYRNDKLNAYIYALPIVLQQQVNSHHPYGMNDGSMIQAKGYQMQLSAGIYAKLGPLSIQFRPELVDADNSMFTTLQETENNAEYRNADFIFQNKIDNPERYGLGKYSRANWGQSSIRLTFDPISFGFSTENLWWGPGVRNSLLMSNNATGFKHFTLNTTKPVNIKIGHIEGQIIAGRLNRSGVPINGTNDVLKFPDKPNDWRYISGIVLTYQPKWIPGLFLGMNRSFIVYRNDMGSGFLDYFPFFGAFEKSAVEGDPSEGSIEDKKKRDQYISIFARYVLPESKAEVYFEFGKNDHSYNGRDFLTKLDHTRAYIIGFRKLVPLNRTDEYIQIGTEITQLAKPASENKNRNGQSWYAHYQVRDGYTNLGQVLGAGIGPGSNLQSLDVRWVKGLKVIGLGLERTDQNNDLYYESKTLDTRRHWVDVAFKGNFSWNFDRLILNSQIAYIHSFNYHYALIQEPGNAPWDWDHQDANNLHIKVGLMYNF